MKKYNRTYHFPWSSGTSDDKIAKSIDSLLNRPIVLTEKCDGSNVCLEAESCFARSHSGPPTHESFDLFKAFHASIKHLIPKGLQIFGENLYALHSIPYDALPNYLIIFNVRDSNTNTWLSWEEVEMWAEELGVPTAPILFKGKVPTSEELKKLILSFMAKQSCYSAHEREGVVGRVADSFDDSDFSKSVLKCVRPNHVQTSDHWKAQEIVKNTLINK